MVKAELRVEEFIPPRDLAPKLADGLGLRVEEFSCKHWSLDVCTTHAVHYEFQVLFEAWTLR